MSVTQCNILCVNLCDFCTNIPVTFHCSALLTSLTSTSGNGLMGSGNARRFHWWVASSYYDGEPFLDAYDSTHQFPLMGCKLFQGESWRCSSICNHLQPVAKKQNQSRPNQPKSEPHSMCAACVSAPCPYRRTVFLDKFKFVSARM